MTINPEAPPALLPALRVARQALSQAIQHDWIDTRTPPALLNRFLAEFEHDGWPGRDHLDSTA
jgi:hypothetical protein